MTKCPVVMKRLYELGLMVGVCKMTLPIEIAIADSRHLRGDDDEEHWNFGSSDSVVQLQAVNCCKCGNYKQIGHVCKLTNKISCACSGVVSNYNAELITKMKIYEGMDTFIDIVNPVGEKDRLCEDVVGVIFEYLHP
jgi:hypothetical protein